MAGMRTFRITRLGCRVNQYEAEQLATLLRARGLSEAPEDGEPDLHIVHTCSVTLEAAAKSRQLSRRATRHADAEGDPRVVICGCWATSDAAEAAGLDGVDAVITQHQDLAAELSRLLDSWECGNGAPPPDAAPAPAPAPGACALPTLAACQDEHQRAYLKIQDGCDARCTYCIIPQLRPALWSKPLDATVDEARRLVSVGHREIVLTGIFLGAYGQPTAIRRRRESGESPLGELVRRLSRDVPGLRRLRLSSIESGDLDGDLLEALRASPVVVPHFHLPLQSGSDELLKRMNRQYRREDFLRMIEALRRAFDRPAFTTDVIVGFPGESDEDFARTLEVVDEARFIHVHAFPYSPRPGTPAAKWAGRVDAAIVKSRLEELRRRAEGHSLGFRQQFLGQEVRVLVERPGARQSARARGQARVRHGRCERYFTVQFEAAGDEDLTGREVRVRVERVEGGNTMGRMIGRIEA